MTREERDPEDIDTPEQGIARFESRFGNLAEFKKKALEEHIQKCTMPKGQCLQCPDFNCDGVVAAFPKI